MMRGLVAAALAGVAMSPATAHEPAGTAAMAARYARAEKLTYPGIIGLVKNNLVAVNWIGSSDRFWYLRQTAAGSEFVVIDAATGARAPAFDAVRVAAALARITGTQVTASALPFTTITLEGDSLAFVTNGIGYRCVLATSACDATGPVPPADWLVSPDGTRAVFVRDGNLWLRDIAGNKENALTSDATTDQRWATAVEPSDFRVIRRLRAGLSPPPVLTRWTPDGKALVTVRVDLTGVDPDPYLDYAPTDGSMRPRALSIRVSLPGEPRARNRFYIVDTATGAQRSLAYNFDALGLNPSEPSGAGWTADGRLLMALPLFDTSGAVLLEIDPVAATVREVIREPGVFPALLNAGGYGVANFALLDGGRSVIWPSARTGWPQLYRYDVRTGRMRNAVTDGKWVVRSLLKVDETIGRLFFAASGREPGNPYYRSIYSVGLDGRSLALLTPETGDKPIVNPETPFGFDGSIGYQPVSPTGRYLVYNLAPLAKPTTTLLRRSDGKGGASVIETADASALLAAGYRPPQEFVVKAADGLSDIHGVIYRPPDYDPARRYPVLDAQYASPVVPIAPRYFGQAALSVLDMAPPSAMALLGFVVVVMDARGTPYRGSAFSTPTPGYLAQMGLVDHVAVLKQLGAREPALDLGRVGIAGMSFGGWTAIRGLLEFPDFFKVGMAWAPPGAFHGLYSAPVLTAAAGVPRYADGALMRPGAAAVPENWQAIDSIAQVGRLRGRLLMGIGGLDENVLPASALQFFDAAARAGKDVEMMFMPRSSHGPLEYLPYLTRHYWDYMVRNLAGETPPGPAP